MYKSKYNIKMLSYLFENLIQRSQANSNEIVLLPTCRNFTGQSNRLLKSKSGFDK